LHAIGTLLLYKYGTRPHNSTPVYANESYCTADFNGLQKLLEFFI